MTLSKSAAQLFVDVATYFGALGFRPKGAKAPELGAEQLVMVTEFLFEAMPVALANSGYSGAPIKPVIEDHLLASGLDSPLNESLVSVLKNVIEQFQRTAPTLGRRALRKKGVADLRASRRLYHAIRTGQRGRCAICGVPLMAGEVEEHLDHIVPFRLIGDVADGSNWQLLCSRCNIGKGEFLSPSLRPSWHNWSYGSPYPPGAVVDVPLETRYSALWARRKCARCQRGPLEAELTLESESPLGPWVRTNLSVVCAGGCQD